MEQTSQRARAWRGLGVAVGLAVALSSARVGAAGPSKTLTDLLEEPALAAVPRAGEAAGDVDAALAVLRVEIAPAIDDAALLPGWIADRHPDLAQAVRDSAAGHAQWIAVQVAGSTYDYRVSVTAVRDGEPLGPTAEPARCECTTEELLALVDVGITAAVEQLRTPPASGAEPASEAGPATPVVAPRVEPPPEPRARPGAIDAPPRRLGTLGYAGIGVGVVGAGLAITGISLALRPDELVGEPGSLERVSTRSVGIGVAASGGVVLGTGLSLLAVDLVRHRSRARAVALAPFMGPRRVGLSFVRRF